MRKYSFLFTLLLLSASSFAQNKDFSYKFYGQVRTDLYYNSRANEETVDGLFYMYPKDKIYDTDGKALNPLVADIHFNPKVADVAAQYVEKVRINPGNY